MSFFVLIHLSLFVFFWCRSSQVRKVRKEDGPKLELDVQEGKETKSRKKVRDFVLEQLKRFEKGVSRQSFDTFYQNLSSTVHECHRMCFFQIIECKVYMECKKGVGEYERAFINSLHYLLQKKCVADVEFILSCHDLMQDVLPQEAPIFSAVPIFAFSKKISQKSVLLVPDPYMLRLRSWSSLVSTILSSSAENGWDSKAERVFFRGASSGAIVEKDDTVDSVIEKGARYKAVALSLKDPLLIDARFSALVQIHPDARNRTEQYFGPVDPHVSEEQHLKFKYLLSMDGNGCSWLRVPWILLSNSLLFKQESALVEWFYGGVEEMKHFIPIKRDLSDLKERLLWAKTHDQEARKIAEEATAFAKENLLPARVLSDLHFTLEQYSKLLNFSPKVNFPPAPPPLWDTAW